MARGPAFPRAEILEDATRTLAEASDRDAALARIAALAVPALAEACVIDVADGEGPPRRAAAYPEGAAPGAEGIAVPLRLRDETLGTLTLAPARALGPEERAAAEDLARCAALAVESGRRERAARRAAQRDEESLALLDTLFTTAPVGLAYWDRDLRFRRINARLAEINGPSVEEHIGRHLCEVLPALGGAVAPLFERVIATGEPYVDLDVSGETLARPGQLRHWISNYYPVRAPSGAILGVGAVVVEITERKQAEEALHAARANLERTVQERTEALSRANADLMREIAERLRTEARLREREHQLAQAQQIARIGSWVWDVSTGQAVWSDELYRIYGVEPRAFQPSYASFLGLVHPADRERVSAVLARSVEEGCFEVEFRAVRPDGAERTIHALGRTIERAGDAATRILGTGQDVTAQKLAEQAQARLAAIVAHSGDAIIGEDLDGVIQTWNAGAEAIYGYRAEEVLGTSSARFAPIDRVEEYHRLRERARRGEATVNLETERVRADGRRLEVAVTLSPIRDASGRLSGFATILRDIGASKASERALRASLREKDVLIKEVHHRVKNNLQVITSLLELQTRHLGDPRSRDVLRESQSRVRSIALVHEKIYQSTDLGSIDFDAYLKTLVHSLIAMYDAPARGIAVDVHSADVRLGIDTAMHCGLIVNELVSNAFKHAFPHGRGGRVRVALRRDGDMLVLAVTDDGVGFPGGIDFRDSPSLGLQLVCSLGDQLGGSVSMTRDAGTTFTVCFPAPPPA